MIKKICSLHIEYLCTYLNYFHKYFLIIIYPAFPPVTLQELRKYRLWIDVFRDLFIATLQIAYIYRVSLALLSFIHPHAFFCSGIFWRMSLLEAYSLFVDTIPQRYFSSLSPFLFQRRKVMCNLIPIYFKNVKMLWMWRKQSTVCVSLSQLKILLQDRSRCWNDMKLLERCLICVLTPLMWCTSAFKSNRWYTISCVCQQEMNGGLS